MKGCPSIEQGHESDPKVYPDCRETDGKQFESVLRLDIYRSLQLLIRFGLVPRSCNPEDKQLPSRSILSPV